MLRSSNYVLKYVSIFEKIHMNLSFHDNKIGEILAILLLKTFFKHSKWNKMECFMEKFKYHHWILPKKLV